MSKSLIWRALGALLVVFISVVYLVPSFRDELPSWWSGPLLPQEQITLGLDLQGGMHLVLEVETQKAVESHLERVVEEIRHDLRRQKLRYLELRRAGDDDIFITLMREEDAEVFRRLARSNFPDFELKPVPDQEGRASFWLILQPRAKTRIAAMAVDQALETIRNRVDQFGVSEPDIRPQQEDRILVQLPGIRDPQRAIALIGKTALLEFKLVDEDHRIEEALEGRVPPGREILYQVTVDPATGAERRTPFLVDSRTVLTGEYITDARVQIDSQFNEPYVSLNFDSVGARLFDQITAENIGRRLAIVLDDRVNSAPVIQDRISGGRAQITGRFTMEDARDLAIVLRAGALPAPVNIIEERTVGPSLGQDSIEKGFRSMVLGGLVVIFFMVFYYRASGIIADMALILNILFIMGGLALFGATLTLPGIAGMILTIGMAVDANVLIFERIREEMRLGKTPRTAIESGYAKALVTILDANITTLIAALVLFQFGTGPIRGFAVTLSIGIVASLFTAIFVTRIVFDYLYVHRRMKQLSI